MGRGRFSWTPVRIVSTAVLAVGGFAAWASVAAGSVGWAAAAAVGFALVATFGPSMVEWALSRHTAASAPIQPDEHPHADRGIGGARMVQIGSLDVTDVIAYLGGAGSEPPVRWRAVVNALRQSSNAGLSDALSTPLMVALARDAFRALDADPSVLLDRARFPDRASIERYLLELFTRSAFRDGPLPFGATPRRAYDPDLARRWLRYLAINLGDSNDTAPATDIEWWNVYRWLPRTRIALAALLLGVVGLIGPAVAVLAVTVEMDPGRIVGVCLALAIGTGLGYIVITRLTPPPPGRVQFRHIKLGNTRKLIATRGMWGFLAGLAVGATAGLAGGMSNGAWSGALVGLVAGLLTALSLLFVAWLNAPVDTVRAVDPLSVLRADRAVMLVTAVLAALSIGVTLGVQGGFWAGLATAIVGSMTGVGLSAWGWFTLARCWLAITRKMPIRMISFLDEAHRRSVLRQSGAAYQFRHLRLQQQLVRQSSEP